MNKVCVSITGQDSSEITQKLANLSTEHGFFEVRLDGLADLSQSAITKIFDATSKLKTVATIRTANEGGKFIDEVGYRDLIEACFNSNASYVDVELAMLNKFPGLVDVTQADRTIISYHNFEQTPTDSELEQVISKMHEVSDVAVIKIACMTRDMNDVNRLTELQKMQPIGKAIIVAMGEYGQILRLLGPSLGAFATFASADSSPVAPGQLYYKEMNKIISLMESK